MMDHSTPTPPHPPDPPPQTPAASPRVEDDLWASAPPHPPHRDGPFTDVVGAPDPFHRRKGQPIVAWLFIALFVIGMIGLRQFAGSAGPPDPNPADPVGMTIMKVTAKYLMGAKGLSSVDPDALEALQEPTETLATGSVDQRLAFVIFSSEMNGAEVAADELAHLEDIIESERRTWRERAEEAAAADAAAPPSPQFELHEHQKSILEALDTLYRTEDGSAADEPRVDALSDDQRDALNQHLGWFGALALNPPGDQSDERQSLERSATVLVFVLVALAILLVLAGLCGLALLIAFLVMAATGRLRSGVDRRHAGLDPGGAWHHGVYAETFAIWLGMFIALMLGAEIVSLRLPDFTLLISAAAMFASLAALLWPRVRGVEWGVMFREIGWTAGRAPLLEPVMGVLGYLVALPILGVGLLFVFLFMFIQGLFPTVEGQTFGGSGGPAHPIIAAVDGGDILTILQVYLVAAVAAPIVEETAFRGVLYRHLRDATRSWMLLLSVLVSAFINCFVFAIIHPQGWVAAPALMALAFAFTLAREWRGTLIPAMVMHGISNGLVMTVLLTCLHV